MLKSIFVSSLVISQLVISQIFAADFEYPEEGESWAQSSVLAKSGGGKNYCGSDHVFQSPINIVTSPRLTCPTSKPLTWSLNTGIHKFKVENTGHNLKMIPECCGVIDQNEDSNDGSDDSDETDDSHDDSNDNPEFENVESGEHFGILTDIFGSMTKYCLDAFHIHWGSDNTQGSEHRIDSKQSVMEMHFVHRACKYTKISEAISIPITNDESAEPTLAVVAVLFKLGDPNLLIQKIVDQIDDLAEPEDEIVIQADDIDMFDVVPMDDGEIIGDYYHYMGSLTTPPCTPVVSWHVLEHKMSVSGTQLQKLRDHVKNEQGVTGGENFRGVKTNSHPVSKCSASGSGDDDSDDN